jgi:N-terminal domain of reverse transcriptase
MANSGDPLLHVVRPHTPKGLPGVDHKVRGQVEAFPYRRPQLSGHRRTGGASLLPWDSCGTGAARISPVRESKPEGEPRGVRVGDAGGRAGHPVMGWRGVEPVGNIPPRASGLTSQAGLASREILATRPQETQQRTAGATPAGAVFPNAVDGPALNGQQAHSMGRRLPARIGQATQAGRGGQGGILQRLLTHAFSAKMLAVQRVTDNQGPRPPGGDGGLWETPEHTAQAVSALRQQGYRTLPLRRVYIPKSPGPGPRPLSMPWRKERARQALYLLALEPLAEPLAAPNS